jgi:hypothetical protein
VGRRRACPVADVQYGTGIAGCGYGGTMYIGLGTLLIIIILLIILL